MASIVTGPVDPAAADVLVFFSPAAIGSYILHGARRVTTNQFDHASGMLHAGAAGRIRLPGRFRADPAGP